MKINHEISLATANHTRKSDKLPQKNNFRKHRSKTRSPPVPKTRRKPTPKSPCKDKQEYGTQQIFYCKSAPKAETRKHCHKHSTSSRIMPPAMPDNGHRDLHKATQPHSHTLPFFKNKQHFKNKIFMQDISKMRIFAQDKLRLGNMEQVSLCPTLIAPAKYKFHRHSCQDSTRRVSDNNFTNK